MGEVYKAIDSRLQRTVAIKVLPELFSRDEERLARFDREARTLASLNHPNIAQIYGLEESPAAGGRRALSMEFIEGENLAERLSRGAIPLDDALAIAKQIVEALEAAHERGIIHRDLKPANVMVRPDGAVKVLDFGLAKASDPAASGAIANSPTITNMHTRDGALLGTAGYMSPEQVKGRMVDRRADIWAFGVVLYELLTGTGPFTAETSPQILARVIEREPDWSRLPSYTPISVVRLLQRCLHKDPHHRLQAIGDARLELAEAVAGSTVAFTAKPLSVASACPGLAGCCRRRVQRGSRPPAVACPYERARRRSCERRHHPARGAVPRWVRSTAVGGVEGRADARVPGPGNERIAGALRPAAVRDACDARAEQRDARKARSFRRMAAGSPLPSARRTPRPVPNCGSTRSIPG